MAHVLRNTFSRRRVAAWPQRGPRWSAGAHPL